MPKEQVVSKLLDALAILGHSVTELNLQRRELIKPDLNRQYASLCSAQVPITSLLFGDNLSQQCKDICETNKLSQKFGLHRASFSAPKAEQGGARGAKAYFHGGASRQGNPRRAKNWYRRKPAAADSGSQRSAAK